MGNIGLYLAQNCPGHPGIQITGFQITDWPLFQHVLHISCNDTTCCKTKLKLP
jgi:hypothetical protein